MKNDHMLQLGKVLMKAIWRFILLFVSHLRMIKPIHIVLIAQYISLLKFFSEGSFMTIGLVLHNKNINLCVLDLFEVNWIYSHVNGSMYE